MQPLKRTRTAVSSSPQVSSLFSTYLSRTPSRIRTFVASIIIAQPFMVVNTRQRISFRRICTFIVMLPHRLYDPLRIHAPPFNGARSSLWSTEFLFVHLHGVARLNFTDLSFRSIWLDVTAFSTTPVRTLCITKT